MDKKILNLKSTTFGGRRFRRKQIEDIQMTVKLFPTLSRSELAHTICEHLNWTTPRGTNRLLTCLNTLEEMETLGIIVLPKKIAKQKKASQKKINHTDQTNEEAIVNTNMEDLMPISIQVVTGNEQIVQWNEFVDRYHYLGYRRLIGSNLRYYILDGKNRKLGCLSFSFATLTLACRDQWVGWTKEQREKHLKLVIKNNRFLIFPWVTVKNMASKVLSLAVAQIADDWETHHGYRPVLLETFVDPIKYKGTCYKSANWQFIGKTKGRPGNIKTNSNPIAPKDVYIYELQADARTALVAKEKSQSKKVALMKPMKLSSDDHIQVWQKIITVVAEISNNFDAKWQKRRRVLTTLLIVLFVFRLVFSKNKQGYTTTIAELWDHCHAMNIPLPQVKPVTDSSFCSARTKLDEIIFKELNTEIIRTYETVREDHCWKQHRIYAVDGSKINLPRQLLANLYLIPSAKAYYPQGLISCLYQLKSKIPVDFDLAAHNNERTMALNHLNVLSKGDVVVYDRGYFSYVMLYAHKKQDTHAVFRLKKKAYKVIDKFMDSSDIDKVVIIEPSPGRQKEIHKDHPNMEFIPLTLRLIKYVIGNETYTIGTTLIDDQRYKRDEFADVYHSRWGVEELYKISKNFIDVEDFHGQTERGVKQELFASFVLITLSRIFANQTDDALLINKNSRQSEKTFKVNFKNCLATIARKLENLFLRQAILINTTVTTIINTISSCCQKVRPNRSYERKSNKPIKKWAASKRKAKNQIPASAIA